MSEEDFNQSEDRNKESEARIRESEDRIRALFFLRMPYFIGWRTKAAKTSKNFTYRSSSYYHLYFEDANPLDKVVELYERLLAAEKEKMSYLEKLANKK